MSNEIVEIITITPDVAEQWLRNNTRNRKVREEHVENLADKIRTGEFKFNGDAIRLSRDNVLLDGQHRLLAVKRSGISIRQVVVRGLDDETQVTMDRQNRRTLGHHLDIMGESNSKTLTATLNMAWQWDHGVRWRIGTNGAGVPSYEQSYEYLLAHPGIRVSVEVTKSLRSKKIMRESTGALLHWVFSRLDAGAAEEFFERLISGAHVDDGDPVWALRERSKDLRADKLENPQTIVPLACKAWNLYCLGKSVKFLRVRVGGDKPEGFPEPIKPRAQGRFS